MSQSTKQASSDLHAPDSPWEGKSQVAAEGLGEAAQVSSDSLRLAQGHFLGFGENEYRSQLDWLLQILAEDQAQGAEPGRQECAAPLQTDANWGTTEMKTSEGAALLAAPVAEPPTSPAPSAALCPPSSAPSPAASPAPSLPVCAPDYAEDVKDRSDDAGATSPRKRRRGYARFSPYQCQVLRERFKTDRNLTSADVERLATQLHLSPRQVRDWFRNERKRYKKWFSHLLDGEHGADSQAVRTLTQGMSCRTAVGSMAQRLLN